ncbi:MAG: class I SAM-dependent methyltransferase [Anaerolineae bacterium]
MNNETMQTSRRGNRPTTSDYHVYRPISLRTPLGVVRLYSKPGIFSWRRLDRAGTLILRALRDDGLPAGSRVLDLGCGHGGIGISLLSLQPDLDLHLADASHVAHTAVSISLERLALPGHAWLSDITADIPVEQRFDVIVTHLPRGRLLAEQFLREAWERLEPGGRFYVAGTRDTGIRTRISTLEEWFGKVDRLAAVSGYRVARAIKAAGDPPPPPSDYREWRTMEFEARGCTWRYVSKPGVFSWEHLDRGTESLLESVDVRQGERVLDLGSGSGQVGVVAASMAPGVSMTMVDDSLLAVRASRLTAELNGVEATVLPSDVGSAVIGERFDVVAANPPFHVGNTAEYDVAEQFIEDSRDLLETKGRLYLVANAFIPYEKHMEPMFRRLEEVHRDNRFKVLLGARPVGRCKDRPKPPIISERALGRRRESGDRSQEAGDRSQE